MNQITNFKLAAAVFSLASVFTLNAQENHSVLSPIPEGTERITNSGNKTTQTNCTDKINYVTSNPTNLIPVGGAQNTTQHIDGIYQVYPSYKGAVTAVEFDAAKETNAPNNPIMWVQIFDVSSTGVALWNTPLGTAVPVTITNFNNVFSYMATFPTPVAITGNYGFAVGVVNYANTDSCAVFCRTITANTNYAFLTVAANNNTYAFSNYFSINANYMIRPIVTTGVNPNWTANKTSTGCGLPVNYNFTNASGVAPTYINNTVINPLGMSRVVDYGDGSPTAIFSQPGTLMHSYTTAGSYTASYTQTYNGWTNACAETKTILVSADASAPSFTYSGTGLTVNFNNTSSPAFNSFIWNFGDLSTSQQNSPTHTFPSPGTYVVELEGTAPCGTVKYNMTIVVTEFNVSVRENANGGNAVVLFPNPAANTLKISTTGENEIDSKIEIFNYTGAAVKSFHNDLSSGSASVDISDLSKGVYFIKLKGKQGEIVKSFVKE